MSESQLSPGTVVDGAYTLDAVVRSRAGATTYSATDGQGAAVWVTIYDGRCFLSGLALERSLRELRQLKSVVSPRVLRVRNAGKHGDGVFEVTEVGPAQTLGEHLQSGALSVHDAATLAVQVGEALLEAQRVGVIHRNLGADVVFPSPQGVRVAGFAVGEPNVRGAGPLMTIAPEQVQGKVVDQRTLIYNVAALTQWMLSGVPLFSGTPEEILAQHEEAVPSESIDAKLRRALGKDPRMRPMMLKQFLSDIAQMGGVEPPKLAARVSAPSIAAPKAPIAAPKAPDAAVARPSSRGWTMFMQAQDDEPAKPAEPEPPPSKPSTRGWTMFMKAQDDDDAGAQAEPPAAAPEPVDAPEPAGSDAPEPAGSDAPPSTRGWTMFMKAEEGEKSSEAAVDEPVSEGHTEAEADPAADEAAPSTRGWTMFTKDEEAEPTAEEPPAEETQAEPPPAEPEAASPSTRGWTMFTKDDEAQDEPAPEPAPEPGAEEPAADAAAPSSRGWTMFMEPGSKDAPSSSPKASTEPAAGGPAQDAEPGADAGAPKKRGWTMFMNAPLEDLPGKDDAPAASPATPVAPNVEASDKQGWTVFGAPALERPEGAKAPEPSATALDPAADVGAPARGKTIMVTHPAPTTPPDTRSADAPDAAMANAPTVVNTGAPAGTPVERGKTMVSTSAPAQKPDTMYFKKGEVEPEGGVSPRAPTVRDVAPATRPVEERVSRTSDPSAKLPAVPEPQHLEPAKSSNTALYAIAGAVAIAAAVAAYFAFA